MTQPTATTDEYGNAEITSNTINTAGTARFNVVCDGKNYPTQITVVNVDDIAFDVPSLVSKGSTIPVSATASYESTRIPNLLMTINGDKQITDSNGKATSSYIGNGDGEVTLLAKCGSYEETITIMDYLMYWNPSENRKLNANYSTRGDLKVSELYSGIQLTSQNNTDGHIYFTYPNSTNEEWAFEFDVVSFKDNLVQISGFSRTYMELTGGDHVKVLVENNSKKTYINDNLESTGSTKSLFVPYLVVRGSITINNIRLYRV